jgi:hypothetical protein
MLGQPLSDGLSHMLIARQPLAATRLISSTAASMFQNGMIAIGMLRPG